MARHYEGIAGELCRSGVSRETDTSSDCGFRSPGNNASFATDAIPATGLEIFFDRHVQLRDPLQQSIQALPRIVFLQQLQALGLMQRQ